MLSRIKSLFFIIILLLTLNEANASCVNGQVNHTTGSLTASSDCTAIYIKGKEVKTITVNSGVTVTDAENKKPLTLRPGSEGTTVINNGILDYIYKQYSKTIPHIGKIIVGSDKPYKYLVESIDKFYNQDQLSSLIMKAGFVNVECRNVSNGISAIHSGWKI